MPVPDGKMLDPEKIRRQLTRLTAHPLFVRSARVRRFLEFTLESQLAGKADQLKEYVLGVEVFDRPASYDPRIDPIVRVEARRVRAKLHAFYQSDGAHDDLIIDYPRGSYVPQLLWRSTPAESPHRAHETPASR
jgi:hypothetical protein